MSPRAQLRRAMQDLLQVLVMLWLGAAPAAFAAETRLFPLGGTNAVLQDVSSQITVTFRSMRFDLLGEAWNTELLITNQGPGSVGDPLVVSFESISNSPGLLAPDGIGLNPQRPFLITSVGYPQGVLKAGASTPPRTVAFGYSGGPAAPRVAVRVFAFSLPSAVDTNLAVAVSRTLDGGGLPLPQASVTESGPAGVRTLRSDSASAVITLGGVSGSYAWRFEATNHLTVWRRAVLDGSAVVVVPAPRLPSRSVRITPVSPLGAEVRDASGTARVRIAPGGVAQSSEATLTRLDGQTLPGLLPLGWSPLAAFWLELGTPLTQPALAAATPAEPIPGSETVVLARWNEDRLSWEAVQSLAGAGTNALTVALPSAGAFVFAVADTGSGAPGSAQAGQPLAAATASIPPAAEWSASGSVSPSTGLASTAGDRVSATGFLTLLSSNAPLPSGVVLQADVSEQYVMQDGTRRFVPPYESFLVAYQRPRDATANTLHARFPMRPLLLAGPDMLSEAHVFFDLRSPAAFDGSVVAPTTGGSIERDGLRVLALPGDFEGREAIRLRRTNPVAYQDLLTSNVSAVASFDLVCASTASGRGLGLAVSNLPPGESLVLARVRSTVDLVGLEAVQRWTSDANGALHSAEPAAGSRLEGLTGAGQYLLLAVEGLPALVSGTVRGPSSSGVSSASVRVQGQPWLSVSDASGGYRIVALPGVVKLVAVDRAAGMSATADVQVPASGTINLDFDTTARGPQVVTVSPAPGSRTVNPVAPVVVTFSDPLLPGSFASDAVVLAGTNGSPVPSSLSLSARGNVATLLPVDPLDPGKTFVLTVSSGLLGQNGLPLTGTRRFEFQTQPSVARGEVAKLTIFQPGATNLSVGGVDVRSLLVGFKAVGRPAEVVVAYGSPGTAESEVPVILVNEGSGETATVLSKVDGSFAGFLRAEETDYVTAVFVNANGTRTTVPASEQRYDDGHTGLYQAGGILEASNQSTPARVIVEPGAISDRSVFKLDAFPLTELLTLVGGQQPVVGHLVGGFRYEESGSGLKTAGHVSVPVKISDLQLPAGSDPAQGGFAMVVPRKYGDSVVYEVLDTMVFEQTGPGQGNLVTHSPPFRGLLARELASLRDSVKRTDLLGQVTVSAADPARQTVSVGVGLMSTDLPLSQGGKIGGVVLSAPFDGQGKPLNSGTPVAGALVAVDRVDPNRAPGFLRAGELVATTGLDGTFALAVPPRDQGTGREVLAMHPRFPFQTARVPFLLPADNTAVARATLFFQEGVGVATGATSDAPPVLAVSHLPIFPTVGAGAADGADLFLNAQASARVQKPTLTVAKAELEDGTVLDSSAASRLVSIAAPVDIESTATKAFEKIRVQASLRARVTFVATVFDNAGLEADVNYSVNFGLSADFGPRDPNDLLGPFVSLVWPPPGSDNIPSYTPFLLRFARPLDPADVDPSRWARWLDLDLKHKPRNLQLSPDHRELLVFYDGDPDGAVSITVHSGLRDEAGHAFDQVPGSAQADSFTSSFTQAGQISGALDGGASGGGIVVQGRFAYGLERSGSTGGTLLTFDLKDPSTPVRIGATPLPGRPNTLSLIPAYALPSYRVSPNGASSAGCEPPQSFVAVFTGAVSETKELLAFPIGADGLPGPAIRGILNIDRDAASQIVKSKWDPPFLGYLDLGDQFTGINLLSFPAFHLGATLQANSPDLLALLPSPGDPGLDADGDGAYCSPGDRAPLPFLDPLHPLGFAFSFAPVNPGDRIDDFDFDSGLGLMAAVMSNPAGTNRLQILLTASGVDLSRGTNIAFGPGLRPKRVLLVPAMQMDTPAGPIVRDLALVSLARDAGGDGELVVVDISDPLAPSVLNRIALPAGEGAPGTLEKRTDGLLALATARSILFLNPSKLALRHDATSMPAIVGRVSVGAGGVRDFVADASGLNAVLSGATRSVVQTEPSIRVVNFGVDPFRPDSLLGRPPAEVQRLLETANPVTALDPATLDAQSNVVPDLIPERHYYVLVEAPGGDVNQGQFLPLVAAAVNDLGQLYDRNARQVVPAVVGDTSVFKAMLLRQIVRMVEVIKDGVEQAAIDALGQELTLVEFAARLAQNQDLKDSIPELQYFIKIIRSWPQDFQARRLSDDPTSPLYNRYLAGPLLILPNSPEKDQADALMQIASVKRVERRYLRASPRVWVGFPSDARSNPVVGRFASQFRLNPHLTLNGVDVPVAGALADRLVDGVLGGSAVLGPALAEIATRFTPVSADYEPTLLPGANTLRLVAYKDRPLVFIPGFAGSRLNQANGEVWPGIFGGGSKTNLAMLPSGQPLLTTTAPDALRDVIEAGSLKFGEFYGGLLRRLNKSLGYVEYNYLEPRDPSDPFRFSLVQRRRVQGTPNTGQDPVPDLFVYPYDWRTDNARAAKALDDYIKLIRIYHPDADGVDLLAHSNGNLVGWKYVLDHPGVVKRYLSAGAPWLGAGKPMLGLLSGDVEELLLNFAIPINDLRRASQFMPGFHQLLWSKGVFDFGFRPIVEQGWDLNHDGQSYQAYDYGQYSVSLATNFFRATHAEVGFTNPQSPVRQNHEGFHQPPALPIGNHSQFDFDMEIHHFIAMQAVPRTVAGVRFVGRLHQQATNVQDISLDLPALSLTDPGDTGLAEENVGDADGPLGLTGRQFRLTGDLESVHTLGDGTVPIISLARGFRPDGVAGLNYNAKRARLHAHVSADPTQDEGAEHTSSLQRREFQDWLDRTLSSRRIDELALTVSAGPVANEGSTVSVGVNVSSSSATPGAVTAHIDFGDGEGTSVHGSLGALPPVIHRYRQNGRYTLSVGATMPDPVALSLSGFSSADVTVLNVAPIPTIEGGSVTVGLNESHLFVATVRDPGADDHHTFTWTFDGEEIPAQHSFATLIPCGVPGKHSLGVTATDSDGDSGQDSIVITVDPAVPPQPPLPPLAGPAPAPPGPAPVIDPQPEVLIRITGLAPGLFDTKGVSVEEGGLSIESILPAVAPTLIPFASQAFVFRKVLLGPLTDALVQRGFERTATVQLRRRPGAAGADPTLVNFLAIGGPVEVELVYSEGGAPVQLTTWSLDALPASPISVRVDWVSLDMKLSRLGFDQPPHYEALGPAAADRQAPSVVGILNPATGNVTLVARDNFSAPAKISLYLAQDASGDGSLEGEVYYELGTNTVALARLPSRLFGIVARDEAGNVSSPSDFQIVQSADYTLFQKSPTAYCDDLTGIRAAILDTFQVGLNLPAVHDLFLLARSHLWLFEQGSGACLWKPGSCQECNGNFIPGVSDDDFQVLLPAHLVRNYQNTSVDRDEFLASGIHTQPVLDGDWYFKVPIGLDVSGSPTDDINLVDTWEYDLPPGFTTPQGDPVLFLPKIPFTSDLSDGFPLPLTPATIIARTLAKESARRPVLKEATFFPVRREHFMYGALDLELPPEGIGSDPLGDGGAGRQLLMLKWALEGAFVITPTNLGVNQGTPTLDDIYANLRHFGVPLAEGLEWGFFQEYRALADGVATEIRATYGPAAHPQSLHSPAGNDLEKELKKHIKKMGKAAIRAALARLAGDPATASMLFSVDRAAYQAKHLASFEDYILTVITNTPGVAQRVFGVFGEDRPPSDGPDVRDFLVAKKASDKAFYDAILADPGGYERFILGGLEFLRAVVQPGTRPGYVQYRNGLAGPDQESERFQRSVNLNRVILGSPGKPGLNDLRRESPRVGLHYTVQAVNYSDQAQNGLTVTITPPPPVPPAPALAAGASVPPLSPGPDAADAFGDDPTEPGFTAEAPTTYGTSAPITQIDLAPVTGDPTEDNGLSITDRTLAAGAPSEPPQPDIRLYVVASDRESYELGDVQASGGHARSPGLFITRDDRISIHVTGPSGMQFIATVTLPPSTASLTIALTEDPALPGLYRNSLPADALRVGPRASSGANGHVLQVKDEEVLDILAIGTSTATGSVTALNREVLIDRAEFASAGISFKDRNLGPEPRPTISAAFTGTAPSISGGQPLAFFSAGDGQFDDTVGDSGSGLNNLMGKFLIRAGGEQSDSGEADFVYSLAHGRYDGILQDHTAPGVVRRSRDILNPLSDFSDPTIWGADVDFVFFQSCAALSLVDFGSGNPNDPSGADNWRAVLRGLNRPPRALFGYHDKTGQNQKLEDQVFADQIQRGMPFVDAYVYAMSANVAGTIARPFAVVFFEQNRNDGLRSLAAHPLPTDTLTELSSFSSIPLSACDEIGTTAAGSSTRPSTASVATHREVASEWSAVVGRLLPRSIRMRNLTVSNAPPSGFGWKTEPGRRVLSRGTSLAYDQICSLTSEAAAAQAKAFLEQVGCGEVARGSVIDVAQHEARRDVLGQPLQSWCWGFAVDLENRVRGIPVWNDRASAEIVGDKVACVSLTWKVEDAEAGGASESAPVIDPLVRIVEWRALTPEGMSIDPQLLILNPRLYLVHPRTLADPQRAAALEHGDYHPAWRMELTGDTSGGEPALRRYLWFDALTGNYLGGTTP